MSEATSNAPLTVVLVHGAFADSSSWNGVIERLQADGIHVTAPATPDATRRRRGTHRDHEIGRPQPERGVS